MTKDYIDGVGIYYKEIVEFIKGVVRSFIRLNKVKERRLFRGDALRCE